MSQTMTGEQNPEWQDMSEPFAQYPYGQYPIPEPPRKRRGRTALGLTATAVIALAAGAGGGVALSHSGSSPTTAASRTALNTSAIASKVDPGIVDVKSTLGDEDATALGTGIVLTSNGEILTNNHVINGATSVSVTDIGNGKTYKATVVGYDESKDVAVLQLSGASGLTVDSLGDSSTVKTGDSVVGLGNAGGVGGTPSVAAGEVTALNQSITASDESTGSSEDLTGMIETNADIQSGDSGGPLVNASGQIVGMDTAASSSYSLGGGNEGGDGSGSSGSGYGGSGSGSGEGGSGYGSPGGYGSYGSGEGGSGYGSGGTGSSSGSEGSSGSTGSEGSESETQGFSIPINTALSVTKQIEAGQGSSTVHIGTTAFLGIELSTESSGQESGSGVTIAGAASGTPAAAAGLTDGDTITSIAGTSVGSSESVQQVLVGYHPGDKVSIAWTDTEGQSHTTTVTLASGPAA
jgi:S1-C subfamily serine protease